MALHPPLNPDPGSSRRWQPWNNHYGIDYNCWTGTPVIAPALGTVIRSGYEDGYGNFIQVRHEDEGSIVTTFAHLSEIWITAGNYVAQGQIIGISGATGQGISGPHLHFDIRSSGYTGQAGTGHFIDPDTLLTPWPTTPSPTPILPNGGKDMIVVYQSGNTGFFAIIDGVKVGPINGEPQPSLPDPRSDYEKVASAPGAISLGVLSDGFDAVVG